MFLLSDNSGGLFHTSNDMFHTGIMVGNYFINPPVVARYKPIWVPENADLSNIIPTYMTSPYVYFAVGISGYEANLGTTTTSSAISNPIVSVGGYFSGDELRFFSQTAFYTRAEEVLELAVLTRFAISKVRVQNAGIQNAATLRSPKQGKFSEYFLNRMGMVNGVSWWWVLATDDYFTTPVITYLRSLIVSAYSEGLLKSYFQHVTGPLFVTSFSANLVTDYVTFYINHGLLYYSSTNPIYSDRAYSISDAVGTAWNAVNKNYYPVNKSTYYPQCYGIVVAAFIASATALQLGVMLPESTACLRKVFVSLLLGTNSAISVDVSDMHIGGFTGMCTSNVDPACSCNQGGRSVWIYRLNANAHLIDQNYFFATSDSKCYFENEDIPVPLMVSFFTFTSGDLTTYNVTMDYAQQLLNSFGVVPRTASNAAIYFSLLNVTIKQDDQQGSYTTMVYSSYPGSVMVGVITTTLANYIGNQLLGIGMLTPVGGSTVATYNEYSISVFPLPSSTVWFALSVPIQGRSNAGDSSHNYCVPTNIIEANISGLSTPISSARTYWNCPSGFLPITPSVVVCFAVFFSMGSFNFPDARCNF